MSVGSFRLDYIFSFKALLLLVAIAVVGGCAVSVVSSNPRSVVLNNSVGRAAGQELAEQECQKYGRHAVIRAGHNELIETYECMD